MRGQIKKGFQDLITYRSDIKVELIQTNATDETVARAAWVSNYGGDAREKEAGRIEGLINYLYRNKHMSPFEHGSFTFYIEAPIFVALEHMRHRTQSYNEWSGRYAELRPHFYIPDLERPLLQEGKVGNYTFTPGTENQYAYLIDSQITAYQAAWQSYLGVMHAGVAKEVARNVLPV